MSREWKEVKLDDVVSILGDGLHGTPKYDENGEYYFINGNNLNGKIVIDEKTKKVGIKEYEKYKKDLNDRTILVSINGTLGKVAIYNGEKVVLGKSACYFNVKHDYSKNFIKYIILGDKFRHYLNTHSTGTTIRNMGLKQMRAFAFQVPPLEEQKAIAHILSTLDEKIETNNQINKKLEEMTQAIFKHWFVDFEFPNENGEPYKSSGGEMVESELGMIPKGWEVEKLSEFGNVITGKTPSTKQVENFGDRYNFITPRDIDGNIFILKSERLLSEVGADKLRTIKIKRNSISVSCIGSNLGEVYINAEDGFTNQQINSITLFKEEMYPYIYIMLKSMKEDFLNLASGSAVPIINKTTFSSIKIIKPSDLLLNKLLKSTGKIFETIKKNLIENNYLSDLRDTLLPKLMSGELRVPLEEDDI